MCQVYFRRLHSLCLQAVVLWRHLPIFVTSRRIFFNKPKPTDRWLACHFGSAADPSLTSRGSVAALQFSLAPLVSILAGKLSKVFHRRDFLRGILTLHLLHEVNNFNVGIPVVFISVLEGNCPNDTVAAYKAFAAAGTPESSTWGEPNRKSSGDICVLSALRSQTVVLCLPLLPRGREVRAITVNIFRCVWSLSSFYCWNLVLSVVFCRGVSNGKMPKCFFSPVVLSVLQAAGSSISLLSPSRGHGASAKGERSPWELEPLEKLQPCLASAGSSEKGMVWRAACWRSEGSIATWCISEPVMNQISPLLKQGPYTQRRYK